MTEPNNSISIVIPTYNNLELFVNAINSVLKQSLLPKEIIVSDDSSSDIIEKWCLTHPTTLIKYHHNKPAKGAVNNWNYGINKATGNWIILLHHDEEFQSIDYLKNVSSHFQYVDIVISDIRIKSLGKIRKGKINGIIKSFLIKNPFSFLIVNPIGPCACICFKKKLLIEFDPNLTWLVDVEWYMRLLRQSSSVIYDSNLIIQSNHGHVDQITNTIDIDSIFKKDIGSLKKKYSNSWITGWYLRISNFYNNLKKFKNN